MQREAHEESVSLEEVILDLGGKPTVRFVNSSDIILKDADDVTKSDIATLGEIQHPCRHSSGPLQVTLFFCACRFHRSTPGSTGSMSSGQLLINVEGEGKKEDSVFSSI